MRAVIASGAHRAVSALALALLAVSALVALPRVTWAQIPPGCAEICGVSCVKPIAIPDRWDDVTGIPGYMGEGSGKTKRPDWRNNFKFDQEQYTDMNGNGTYDPGEPYVDDNRNGKYDSEAYDPLTTGYVAGPTAGNALAPAGDFGLEMTLAPTVGTSPIPGLYQTFDLPPANKSIPVAGSSQYLDNWANCNGALVEPGDRLQVEPGSLTSPTNQAMRGIIAQDPTAYWDPVTQSVQGSAFPLSPRVIFIAAYDPRLPITSGSQTIRAPKLIPIFMEQMSGSAIVLARFLRVSTSGSTCAGGSAGGFFYACPTPATRASWGQVKATYR